jgi:uncharacterized small protein (DUF1192 family)
MDKNRKSKAILGQSGERIIFPKPAKYFSQSEKEYIIQEYLQSGCSKREIWQKYTGQKEEHGNLLTWMRELSYCNIDKTNKVIVTKNDVRIVIKDALMQKNTLTNTQNSSIQELTVVELQDRIAALEKELQLTQIRAVAYSTMIDIAEKEFNIPIRKK